MEIEKLYKKFDKVYEEEVKPFIERNIPRDKLSEPVYYILDNFRLRRFRAAFPVIFAEQYATLKEQVLPIGAASELVFTIALVQDDIIDGDERRGDIPAAHKKYGVEVSIASADYMHSQVAKMLGKLRRHRISPSHLDSIFDSFVEAHRRLYKSFIEEKVRANKFDLAMEDILDTYRDKTIQGTNSLYCAALLCTGDETAARLIKDFSFDLAIAGQIKNDIYDATSYLANRGYSDLDNGYVTYVIRKLLDSAPDDERRRLMGLIVQRKDDAIISAIKRNQIIEGCLRDCDNYVSSAISRVKGEFPPELEEILVAWAEGNRKFSRKI